MHAPSARTCTIDLVPQSHPVLPRRLAGRVCCCCSSYSSRRLCPVRLGPSRDGMCRPLSACIRYQLKGRAPISRSVYLTARLQPGETTTQKKKTLGWRRTRPDQYLLGSGLLPPTTCSPGIYSIRSGIRSCEHDLSSQALRMRVERCDRSCRPWNPSLSKHDDVVTAFARM